MDRNEFYEQMRKKIEENLPESVLAEGELVIKEARKNNDVMMHGIMISREYLENLKLINEKYLASKGMEFNPKKTKVFSIKDGFTFLGFKYRLTDTGKVIMTVSSEKVKERRRKLRKLVRKAKRGEITKAKVDDCYQAWRSHASKGNSFRLICRMDEFYKNLWNDQETEVTDNENQRDERQHL